MIDHIIDNSANLLSEPALLAIGQRKPFNGASGNASKKQKKTQRSNPKQDSKAAPSYKLPEGWTIDGKNEIELKGPTHH